ncbi:DUF2521 family protein [Ammoniphilus sp. CFH 90114]|uniref:DUF2521 family protein n=1 Tax=Ammoniphilus sp. CFH 90114 TaxID=2493665 RepID=UPI00100FCD5C|nr:DUF2521 family protein [Ammoniphilus sp. CFH 90114]RXT05331.1 DUF2521 family protein [Ammoniphilus sp. CFH 90114]
MEDNIVSFEKLAVDRHEALQKKALYGIDSQELNKYYEAVVKDTIEHFSFLQKYLAEEFLGDTVIDCFTMGIKASKLRLDGKSVEDIEYVYSHDLQESLAQLSQRHQLYQFLRELDVYSLSMMAEDLGGKWFRKGILYGEKQRKMRLM